MRVQLPCGHWAEAKDHPVRCPRCEAGHMRDDRDPYENRREREWKRGER